MSFESVIMKKSTWFCILYLKLHNDLLKLEYEEGMGFSPTSVEATSGKNRNPHVSWVAWHEWQMRSFTHPFFLS